MSEEEKPSTPPSPRPETGRTPDERLERARERMERARERMDGILESPLYRRIRDRGAAPQVDDDVDLAQLMRDIQDLAALISELETAYDEFILSCGEVLRERRIREGRGDHRDR